MYLFKVWLHSSQLALRIGDVWLLLAVVATTYAVATTIITNLKVPQDYLEIPTVPHRTPGNPTTNEQTNARASVIRRIVLTAADCLLRRRLTMVNQSANDTTTTTTTTTTLRRLFIDADDDVIVDGGRRRFGRQQQRRT